MEKTSRETCCRGSADCRVLPSYTLFFQRRLTSCLDNVCSCWNLHAEEREAVQLTLGFDLQPGGLTAQPAGLFQKRKAT
eukprot:987056-Pelagomonas_calceolata.AAC.3